MALLKYFTRVNSSSGTVLPNPESSLNRVVDRKAIEAANEEVTKIRSQGKGANLRQHLHRKHLLASTQLSVSYVAR